LTQTIENSSAQECSFFRRRLKTRNLKIKMAKHFTPVITKLAREKALVRSARIFAEFKLALTLSDNHDSPRKIAEQIDLAIARTRKEVKVKEIADEAIKGYMAMLEKVVEIKPEAASESAS
jgi:hypothetical protein